MHILNLDITSNSIDILVVLMLGVLVGFIELISRYEDAPFRTATTFPGLFYMLINGVVAVAALLMIRLFGWKILPGDSTINTDVERWAEVLIAGLGAMSIFRSSVLVVGKGDQEVSVGPSAVLEILLDTIDKEVDRFQAQSRAKVVSEIMAEINYEDAKKDLPYICMALMQNLDPKDGDALKQSAASAELFTGTTPDAHKIRFGLILMDIVGEDVLREAIGIMKKKVDSPDSSAAKNVSVTDPSFLAALEEAKNKAVSEPPAPLSGSDMSAISDG